MLRSTYSGTFLLVEGASDKKFYGHLIDQNSCCIEILAGKPSSRENVIKALEILEADQAFKGFLGIIDADFDRLNQVSPPSDNCLLTDTHDLETMILKSPALEKLLGELGSETKVSTLSKKNQLSIRNILLNLGLPIGYLRWISETQDLNLKFSTLEVSNFVDKKDLQMNEYKLLQKVIDKTQKPDLDAVSLLTQIQELQAQQNDPWQVCCGHDLVKILSLGLRTAIGSHKSTEVDPQTLEQCLRLAYEASFFVQTALYQSIREWENRNQPFKVLS